MHHTGFLFCNIFGPYHFFKFLSFFLSFWQNGNQIFKYFSDNLTTKGKKKSQKELITSHRAVWEIWFHIAMHAGFRGIFFRGGKVIFVEFFPGLKCFFPVENSHFGRPKTNFSGFEKWKAKKKKKKGHLW